MRYCVSRSVARAEYCEVEAKSDEEAIKKAKLFPDDAWEENPNDQYLHYYDYNAEPVND